mgnify:CR=1 FL=1
MPSVKEYRDWHSQLTNDEDFTNAQTLAQDVNSIFLPRRSDITEQKSTGRGGWYDPIYEPAPINAVNTLASGQYDILFTGDWFRSHAPTDNPTDEHKKAYDVIGDTMRKKIDKSNFALEIQEFLTDRSAPHTSAMLTEWCKGRLRHTFIPFGQYAIAEDDEKNVDTLDRWFEITALQAKKKFNLDDDVLPKIVQEALKSPSTWSKKFKFIHMIHPNVDAEKGSEHKKDKPWKSVYFLSGGDEGDGFIREGGYDEQPFVVSRFNRYGNSVYGTGPCHQELGRGYTLQVQKRDFVALGERITNPGFLRLAGHGDTDIDPYRTNDISEEEAINGYPREIQYANNVQLPFELFERDIKELKVSLFNDLFELLRSDMQREKTAYEVSKLLEEQVGRAAPTFNRLNDEVLSVYLTRVFGILSRNGQFPREAVEAVGIPLEGNTYELPDPKIEFTSKLAMMMKAVKSNSVQSWMIENQFWLNLHPEKIDNIDIDGQLRDSWEDNGLPQKRLVPTDDRDKSRQARMEQEQGLMALQAGKEASEIEKNIR